MDNKNKFALIFLVLATIAVCSPRTVNAQSDSFSYRITPKPQIDRTELEISLVFQNIGANSLTVELPSDCFGTPDLYKYVTKFEGVAGTEVHSGKQADQRIVKPNADGSVSLRYTLSFDPKAMETSPYSPNTGPDHFHLAGCQYLLPIGDKDKKVKYQIEINSIPTGWKIYSTSSVNAAKYTVESSYESLSSSALGGGRNSRVFYTKKGRVAVFVHGDFETPTATIYSSIEHIIRAERKWFADYDQPNYTIVVAPRRNVTSGYAPDNGFICFVDRKTKNEDLSLLVAHEFFHNWLPNKIEIVQKEKYSDLRFEWFSEGFTDYFARRILHEAKLMTEVSYLAAVNRNIYNIADNPLRAKTYDELVEMGKVGKFDGVAKKLAYFRGALIALNWNAQIQRQSKKLDLADFIRKLYNVASKTNGKISEQSFLDLARSFGVDAEGDLERFIMRGEAITPDADALGSAYELSRIERPSFDIGFSLEDTQRSRRISAVRQDGPAFAAGLRDGMEFIGVENAYRFSNAWKDDRPLVVRVKVENGERTFQFYPHGSPMSLPLFSRLTKNQ